MKKLFLSILMLMFLSAGIVYAVDFDFGGETVVIAESSDLIGRFEEGENLAHFQQVEKDFNVKIELLQLPWNQMRDQLTASVMAGDPFADVFALGHRNLWGPLPQGTLLPLNEALEEIDYYNRLPEYSREYIKQVGNWNGHIFGFGLALGASQGIIWNKSLFDREGLPDLYELYNDGDWTWDAFRDIIENTTRDTTGDGEIDLWGYTGTDDLNYWLRTNGSTALRFEDNRPIVPLQEENAMDTIVFLHDLISRGLVNSIGDQGARRDLFFEGNSAMHLGHDRIITHFIPEDAQDEFGFVPMPKGPAMDRHVAPDRGGSRLFRIPINVDKDPAALIELVSALLMQIEPYTDTEADFEEMIENFAIAAHDFESIENYRFMRENMVMEFYHIGSVKNNIAAAYDGQISVAAAVEQGLQNDQARMDDVFDAIEEVYGIADY